MSYLPSLFGEDLMDDWMGAFDEDFFGKRNPLYGRSAKNVMKTDVREKDGNYELLIDLPGFKKEEVQLQLQNGYLTIAAAKGLNKDEKDKQGRLIRQERYAGRMSRSFYVGENLTVEDVHAKFENGVLTVTVPKEEQRAQIPEQHTIAIEG